MFECGGDVILRNIFFVLLYFFALYLPVQGSEDIHVELTGKLVKRNFYAPRIVKKPAFAWFLELDISSKDILVSLADLLGKEDKELISIFNLDFNLAQLLVCLDAEKEICRHLEGKRISIKGRVENPPYLCSQLPVYQMHFKYDFFPKLVASQFIEKALHSCSSQGSYIVSSERGLSSITKEAYDIHVEDLNEVPRELPEGDQEVLVKLTGKLILRLSPGPPNYSDVEAGDYPSYVWYLQMDPASVRTALSTPVWGYPFSEKEIMDFPNWFEVQLGGAEKEMEEWFCDHIDQTVSVQGYLFHAHTGHHHAPFLLAWESVQKGSGVMD